MGYHGYEPNIAMHGMESLRLGFNGHGVQIGFQVAFYHLTEEPPKSKGFSDFNGRKRPRCFPKDMSRDQTRVRFSIPFKA